jgi:hypothetical protein
MKIFFFVINKKKKKLLIITLKNEVGVFIRNKEEFEQACTQSMASILKKHQKPCKKSNNLNNRYFAIMHKFTNKINKNLEEPILEEELKMAMKAMAWKKVKPLV